MSRSGPDRRLIWYGSMGAVDAIGTGMFYPITFLYYLHFSKLSLPTLGWLVTTISLAALPLLFLVGGIVDRVGSRSALLTSFLLRGVCFPLYLLGEHIWIFAAVTALIVFTNRVQGVASPTLAADAAVADQWPRWVAVGRACRSAGTGVGAVIGSSLVTLGDLGYDAVTFINAATFLLAGALALPVVVPKQSRREKSRRGSIRSVSRDRPFMGIATVNALLFMVGVAIETALPIILIQYLELPSWMVGASFTLNTIMLAVLQVPLGERASQADPRRVMMLGTALQIVFVLICATASRIPDGLPIIAVVLGGFALHTLGELVLTQVASVLLLRRIPSESRGLYLSMNQLLMGISAALVPGLVGVSLDFGVLNFTIVMSVLSVFALLAGHFSRAVRSPIEPEERRSIEGVA